MPPNQMPPPSSYGYSSLPPAQKKGHRVVLIILLILFILLFFGASGFGYWAFTGRQDYKDNVDKKVQQAVTVALKDEDTKKDAEFAEKEKSPYKEYKSPSTFASVDIIYPKTWSAFVTESEKASIPIDGYFHPAFVPGVQSGTDFALRIQITNQTYDQELKQFEAKTKTGTVKVSPYKAPKVPNVLGSRVDGEINTGQKDSMVLFPVRDKTLKISTESDQFLSDFNNIILPNLTFVP